MSESPQPARYFSAVHLGASSGRVVAAHIDDEDIRVARSTSSQNRVARINTRPDELLRRTVLSRDPHAVQEGATL